MPVQMNGAWAPLVDGNARTATGVTRVVWLCRYGDLSELKRDRAEPPDTESARRWRMMQAEQGQETIEKGRTDGQGRP